MGVDLQPLWITLQVAFYTTVLLIVLGTPLALWLARIQGMKKAVFEAMVALPLVLPPTVLGFYLLVTIGPGGPIGPCSPAEPVSPADPRGPCGPLSPCGP